MGRRWAFIGLTICLWTRANAAPEVSTVEPRVAVHPLVILEGEAEEAARLQAAFGKDLESRNIDLVKPECVTGFLRPLAKNGCAADEACLARLARTCSAARAVYVAAVSYEGKVVFSGKVVRATGLTERTVSGVEVRRRPGPAGEDAVRRALHDFLSDDLKLDSLDLGALVEPPPGATTTSSAATPGPNGLRIAGWSVGGAAVAVGIAGGAVWLASLAPHNELNGLLDANGRIVGDHARGLELQRTLNSQSAWTTGLWISAGALAASSIVMLVLSKDAPATTPQVSVTADPRNVGITLSGRF
jgi:hypothetical protein